MYQTISAYQIADGTDPDEFWDYHVNVHAVDVANAVGPALKKYVVKRVIGTVRGNPTHFGMVEMWWDSKEARIKDFQHADTIITASGKNIGEDFQSRTKFEWYVEVDEAEIELPALKKGGS